MNNSTTANQSKSSSPIYLSEIFPLTFSYSENMRSFKLKPLITKEDGNYFSYHLSKKLEAIVIYEKGIFTALPKKDQLLPSPSEFKEALDKILTENEKYKNVYCEFEWLKSVTINAKITSQLAYQILRINNMDNYFANKKVFFGKNVFIQKKIDFSSESISLDSSLNLTPALSLSTKSNILCNKSLGESFDSDTQNKNPEEFLTNLEINIENDDGKFSVATIKSIVGKSSEIAPNLLEKATNKKSIKALEKSINEYPNYPIVAVKYPRSHQEYHYSLFALTPVMNEKTITKLGLNYGDILKKTKLKYEERKNLIIEFTSEANKILQQYNFKLEKSINSQKYPNLFLPPTTALDEVNLLFGNGVTNVHGKIAEGLKEGGVYKYHEKFLPKENETSPIVNIAVVKLCDLKIQNFLDRLENKLKEYHLNINFIKNDPLIVKNFQDISNAELKVKIENLINDVIISQPDLVLVILPKTKDIPNNENKNFYDEIYSQLLNAKIASQFITEKTLIQNDKEKINYLLPQIVPGILAKLGNLPFILAESLNIADYILGLDIGRITKKNSSGTMNSCASIRLYGNQGEFCGYHQSQPFSTEGEEIPKSLIEKLLRYDQFEGKKVLIYRDGLFRGDEIKNFLDRGNAINCKLILVESIKSGISRFFELKDKISDTPPQEKTVKILDAPPRGLAIKISAQEAFVVTTKVAENMGLARPLRLKICSEGEVVPIEQIVDVTLKLTLLHHGSNKTTRLPVVIHGADKMAYLSLRGISPREEFGDRQYWL